MSYFTSGCCPSTLNIQVLFYDSHYIHFYYRSFNILKSHHIHSFTLKVGDSVNDQPNNNGPNLNLNILYGNVIMKWMRKHGTLKFTPAHMNSVLFEKWESLKISYATITQEYFKKKHISPPYLYDKVKNHQACLAATQKYKGRKLGEI